MKKDWKKEAKEILEILAYTAVSAFVVFHVNYSCSRKPDTQPTDDTAKVKAASVAADTITARNSLVRNVSGKVR